MAFPCGQCIPCRINRRRMWTHRIMLESLCHGDNSFLTLTYDEEHLPYGGNLVPKDLQDWLKRFRKSLEPLRVRYFAVGEYGDASERPHYHVAMFGYPPCEYGMSRYTRFRRRCCPRCDQVSDTWGKGNILSGTLETHSAQYIAGYVTKKMTSMGDPRLKGRYPEFSRMSLRPGIGHAMMHDLASSLMSLGLDNTQADVPSVLRHNKKLMPLGRYLRRKLRVLMGKDENAPPEALAELQKKMLLLLHESKNSEEVISARSLLIQKNSQKVLSIEAQAKIYKGNRTI